MLRNLHPACASLFHRQTRTARGTKAPWGGWRRTIGWEKRCPLPKTPGAAHQDKFVEMEQMGGRAWHARIRRQLGEPSEPAAARWISSDLLRVIRNTPNAIAGLWWGVNLPANQKLLSKHHQVILKYNGPVFFLPLFFVFPQCGC